VNTGRDDALTVANDRKVTVDGSQAHKTTKDHLSLVEGNHSLEVKGDLAQKVAGALGTDAQGDIVLQSNTKITLRVGSSFVVIHPSGVDISGLKINLNSGGRPGDPVHTQLPAVLNALAGEGDAPVEQPQDNGGGNNSGNGGSSGGKDEPKDEDESDQYKILFNFKDTDGSPYIDIKYIAYFADGTQREGITDKQGNTELFIQDDDKEIEVKLFSRDFDTFWGGEK
jgi:type VI secretion system secreted protein VgrG